MLSGDRDSVERNRARRQSWRLRRHRDAARGLAGTFEVDDRVTFVHSELASATDLAGDAYYFFNPFGDYAFESDQFAEPGLAFTPETHKRDIIAVNALLARAPLGTIVITYNGFGGKVPVGYEQIDVATRLPGTLRLWKKQDRAESRPAR